MVQRQSLTHALIALVPVAAIGPNIGGEGLRTEHVYAVIAAVVLVTVNGVPSRLTIPYLWVLSFWAVVLLVALVGGLVPLGPWAVSLERTVPEGMARLMVPILGLVIGAYAGWAGTQADDREPTAPRFPLQTMFQFVVAIACVNSAVAVSSIVGDFSLLTLFRSDTTARIVSDYAARGGRYGGFVNQPFEAGLLYSVALLTVSRQWVVAAIGSARFAAFFSCIVLGGAISGSKVFLFGGAPATLIYVLSHRPLRLWRCFGLGSAALLAVLTAWLVLSEYNQIGLDRLKSVFAFWESDELRLAVFAGRLDTGGRTMDGLTAVLSDAGPFGYGASGGMTGAYDIGIMEFASVAGWSGMAAMVVMSITILVSAWGRERYWLVLAVLVVGANLGGPAFTANRSALVVWVLLGAMLQCGMSSVAEQVAPWPTHRRATRLQRPVLDQPRSVPEPPATVPAARVGPPPGSTS